MQHMDDRQQAQHEQAAQQRKQPRPDDVRARREGDFDGLALCPQRGDGQRQQADQRQRQHDAQERTEGQPVLGFIPLFQSDTAPQGGKRNGRYRKSNTCRSLLENFSRRSARHATAL